VTDAASVPCPSRRISRLVAHRASVPHRHRTTRRRPRRRADKLHAVPDATARRSRSLAAALEPMVGQVYFSVECHEAYAQLGFAPSPGQLGAVALPDGPAYFTSRGSLLG